MAFVVSHAILYWFVATDILILAAADENATLTRSLDMETNKTTIIASQNNQVKFDRLFCYQSSKPVPEFKDRCCSYESWRFRSAWQNGGYYLTSLLERLQRWECEEFKTECKDPSYDFTEFNKIVYERFCFPSAMQRKCKGIIQQKIQEYGFENIPEQWNELIEYLDLSQLSNEDIKDPCISIALFDRSSGGVGRFHEVVENYFPFCGIQWNGYDYNVSRSEGVSVWTGLSTGCRGALVFFMTLMGLFAIVTIAANAMILLVFGSNKKLRNSQAIFQMSLAIADLLVGLVVWPNMIGMQVVYFINPRFMGDVVTEARLSVNGTVAYFPNFGKDDLERRFPSRSSESQLSHEYKFFLGFFMLTSIFVSVITLMAASFDRLSAISFPLRHRRRNPKRGAFIVCVVVWIICIIFALLPVVVPMFEYDSLSSTIVSADGTYGTALALSVLIIPLVVTLIVSMITFHVSRRHRKETKDLFSTSHNNASKTERRLAKTLGLMVGVFTISVLPAVVCIVIGSYFVKSEWQHPRTMNLVGLNAYASIEYISVLVLTLNSLWNCLIYSIRNPGFRKAAKQILLKKKSQKGITTKTMRDTHATVMSKRSSESKTSPTKLSMSS